MASTIRDRSATAVRTFLQRLRTAFAWQTIAAYGAAALIAAGALLFDALTPQMVEVGLFYVAIVLTGFWFPDPRAALVLALITTPLIIIGYGLTIPDASPVWAAWMNRALSIGTVWLTAVFVWHNRVLAQKLQAQIDVANSLSREMSHRVGNSLQLVASFLRLQAASAPDQQSRQVLEAAGSRVMVIGKIERLLSHAESTGMVDLKAFINALVDDMRSTLVDPGKIDIRVVADNAVLPVRNAVVLGALLAEVINNALKHAFPRGMSGVLTVRLVASQDHYLIEVEDDGVGTDQSRTRDGFGMRTIAELVRLIHGSVTSQDARKSDARPGTIWKLVVPRGSSA